MAASEAAHKKGGDLAQLLVDLLGYVMEQADLRSWLSLPRDFQVARFSVPAGTHTFRIVLEGHGPVGSVSVSDVVVREGGMTLIALRSIGNMGAAKHVTF